MWDCTHWDLGYEFVGVFLTSGGTGLPRALPGPGAGERQGPLPASTRPGRRPGIQAEEDGGPSARLQ